MTDILLKEIKEIEGELIEVRRALHRIPEIGDRLPRTKAFVCDYLKNIGVPYREIEDSDAIIADVCGSGEGKTVAFRADMDALHICEATGLPFSSEIEGHMHGCGHDAHTAMLLLTAKLLASHRDRFCGRVRCIFQTGEEIGTGAKKVIAAGGADGVDAMFAIHVGNLAGDSLSAGEFAILPGYVSSKKVKFNITVKGKGTHSAFPEKGIDPIIVAAKILVGFKDIMDKEIPRGAAAILSVGCVHAGEDHNTIPETATIHGSFRTHDIEISELLTRRVEEISHTFAEEVGAKCIIEMKNGSPSVRNDEKMAAFAAEAVSDVFGKESVRTSLPRPLMASDDFSFFANAVPSVYFMLHTNNEAKGMVEANHNPHFDVDEDVLYRGVAAYCAIAMKFLEQSR